jgi:rhodanese-related sulfurtransferase
MRVPTSDSAFAETTLFALGAAECSPLTARAAFQEALHGRASILDLRTGSERAAEGELPAYLSSGGVEGHRRLIALTGRDDLDLGLPRIVGGFAGWRAAGMPVAAAQR